MRLYSFCCSYLVFTKAYFHFNLFIFGSAFFYFCLVEFFWHYFSVENEEDGPAAHHQDHHRVHEDLLV